MSFSNQFMTKYLDPQYFDQNRAVFILDDTNSKQLLNMRLSEVGCLTNTTKAFYNPTIGAWSLIKSISLMSGNKVLCSNYDVPTWMGFKQMMGSNQSQFNKKRVDSSNRWGFVEGDFVQSVPRKIQIDPESSYNKISDSANEYENNRSRLYLRDVFPLLAALEQPQQDGSIIGLDCSQLQDLRLEIQWNSNKTTNLSEFNGTAAQTSSIKQPVLLVDEMLNPNKKQSVTVSYVNMYYEVVPVNAINASTKQEPN